VLPLDSNETVFAVAEVEPAVLDFAQVGEADAHLRSQFSQRPALGLSKFSKALASTSAA
jgi:hypothetical protein